MACVKGQHITDRVHVSGGRIVLLRLGHFGLDVSDLICGRRHLSELFDLSMALEG